MEKFKKSWLVCLSPDIFCITGHLREFATQHIDDTISSRFCEEHRNTPCPDILKEGCYGFYDKSFGLIIKND